MDASLEKLVWQRAQSRYEYCHLPVGFSTTQHQIDHIIAQKHKGETTAENLALACFFCNSYKGPNIAGIDPLHGSIVRLFNPRQDEWTQHFAWSGPLIIGLTPMGERRFKCLK